MWGRPEANDVIDYFKKWAKYNQPDKWGKEIWAPQLGRHLLANNFRKKLPEEVEVRNKRKLKLYLQSGSKNRFDFHKIFDQKR